jgi:hypothetical protein
MAGVPPTGGRSLITGARSGRRRLADRYLLPPLAALVGTVLRLYPAKGHLRALASWLVQGDAPRPSDVIVVLGGGSVARARNGAALYARGLAPAIYLSTDVDRQELVGTGARSSYDILRHSAVPAAAIVHDRRPGTTADEAHCFIDCALHFGWRSALIVTDPYHTRRARRAFDRAARRRDDGIALTMVASDHGQAADAWWESQQTCQDVLHEYAGLVCQHLRDFRLSNNRRSSEMARRRGDRSG